MHDIIFEAVKESKYVKSKIAGGYLLLIIVCILSVGHVYRTVMRLSQPDRALERLQEKRTAINRILYHLYQAESYGQLAIAGSDAYTLKYRREMSRVGESIDSLRLLTDTLDRVQMGRLDSITWLLKDKQRRMTKVQRVLTGSGVAHLLDRNIELLIAPQNDTLRSEVADTVIERVVHQDTTAVPRKKRRFFRRFADLFSPPKEDSSVLISRSEVVGTASKAVVKDTIAAVLQALKDSVQSSRQMAYDQAWQESRQLRYSNEQVTTKIYRLIRDFEQENNLLLMERINRSNEIRRNSSWMLGGIAVVAVVMMLLFVAVLWRDVSRSNRYRRELEEANRQKEALLKVREQLMLAITHDIKAPLGSVMGYIDLMARLTSDRRQELYLDNMRSSSEHLLALVNSLLDFYRLDMNKVELNRVAFNPQRLAESILGAFQSTASKKNLRLTLDATPEAGVSVVGDVLRIRQIIENLVSNALKFTDHGEVRLRVDRVEDKLVWMVKDTGRGISREERDRIFAEFVRLDSARGVDGFGLGLSIVDRLLRLLKGHIALESTPGKGSRFTVWIPVAKDTAMPSQEASAEGVRVLLVDDDRLQLEMTEAMCRRAGIESVGCDCPEYVERLIAKEHFDLVLTDLQMPQRDGYGVLNAVRGQHPEMPVVVVSAHGQLTLEKAQEDGFSACLQKPFTYTELVGVIRRAVPRVEIEAEPSAESPADQDVAFSALTAFAGEDREAACEILRSFHTETSANLGRFREAYLGGDFGQMKALAHKMLPIFKMLEVSFVSDVFQALERGEEVSEARIVEVVAQIERVIEEAQRRMDKMNNDDETENIDRR